MYFKYLLSFMLQFTSIQHISTTTATYQTKNI